MLKPEWLHMGRWISLSILTLELLQDQEHGRAEYPHGMTSVVWNRWQPGSLPCMGLQQAQGADV